VLTGLKSNIASGDCHGDYPDVVWDVFLNTDLDLITDLD
jgi:hypothetical protein